METILVFLLYQNVTDITLINSNDTVDIHHDNHIPMLDSYFLEAISYAIAI